MEIHVHNFDKLQKFIEYKLGESTAGVYYTNVYGKPGYFGTDGASNTGRVIPITDVSAQTPDVIILQTEENAERRDGNIFCIPINGAWITTDNLKSGDLPAVGDLVYLQDDGSFGKTDTGTAGVSCGRCVATYPATQFGSTFRTLILSNNYSKQTLPAG